MDNKEQQHQQHQQHQQGYQSKLPGFIPKDKYLEIMKYTPLISTDIVVFNSQGEVLLGKRTTEPAKNEWFVPGGRLRINETCHAAITRIAVQELGIILDKKMPNQHRPKPLGVYHQTYNSNFENNDYGAHYITFAYTLELEDSMSVNYLPTPDYQHSEFKWWSISDLLKSDKVNIYCKNYFHPSPWNNAFTME